MGSCSELGWRYVWGSRGRDRECGDSFVALVIKSSLADDELLDKDVERFLLQLVRARVSACLCAWCAVLVFLNFENAHLTLLIVIHKLIGSLCLVPRHTLKRNNSQR